MPTFAAHCNSVNLRVCYLCPRNELSPIDAEEQEILDSFQRREWRSVGNIKRENKPGHDVREVDDLKRRPF